MMIDWQPGNTQYGHEAKTLLLQSFAIIFAQLLQLIDLNPQNIEPLIANTERV